VRPLCEASDQSDGPCSFTAATRKSYVVFAHRPSTRIQHLAEAVATASALDSSLERLDSLSEELLEESSTYESSADT